MTARAAGLLAEIKAAVAALEAELAGAADAGVDEAEASLPPAALPLQGDDLLEVPVAARRFGIPPDTLRSWLRRDATLGKKVGGRWHASARHLRERLMR